MKIDPALIDRIYETSIATERWPALLQDLATDHGATGAIAFTRSPTRFDWIAATDSQRLAQDYMDGEWWRDPYPEPLVREMHPGFRSGTDYYSLAEVEAFPVNRDFLRPRGIMADVSTIIQGAGDDVLQLAIFGFPSFDVAAGAIAAVDALRPHLARAISLTSQLMAARAQSIVASLALGGIAAAVVSGEGRLKAMNGRFETRLGDRCDTRRHRLRFADPFLDQQFTQRLGTLPAASQSSSMATRVEPGSAPLVVHLLPLRGAAREIADSDGVLLILADSDNACVPNADILRLLFDLTPAEARVARLLAEGEVPAGAAQRLGVAIPTIRVQMKAIFAKTGVASQADLRMLLGRLGTGR